MKPLLLLSVADLLLAVSWLLGAFLFSHGCESSATCYNLHTVEQVRGDLLKSEVNAPVFGEHECTLAMGLECLHLPIRLQFESLKHTLIVGHAVA